MRPTRNPSPEQLRTVQRVIGKIVEIATTKGESPAMAIAVVINTCICDAFEIAEKQALTPSLN